MTTSTRNEATRLGSRMREAGFTLIELLVVIAIVTGSAVFILPAVEDPCGGDGEQIRFTGRLHVQLLSRSNDDDGEFRYRIRPIRMGGESPNGDRWTVIGTGTGRGREGDELVIGGLNAVGMSRPGERLVLPATMIVVLDIDEEGETVLADIVTVRVEDPCD